MKTKPDRSVSDTGLEYGHRLLLEWASGIARGMRYPSEEARELLEEAATGDSFADLRAAEATSPLLGSLSGDGEESWRRFREALGPLREITGAIPTNLPARRIRELGRILGLDGGDVRILEVLLFSLFPGPAEAFLEFLLEGRFGGIPRTRHCSRGLNADNRHLPRLLGMSREEFRRRLDPKSRLVRKGLVEVDGDLDIDRPDTLRRLYLDTDGQADVRSLLLGQESADTDLEWSDFAHLGQDREDLAAVLRGAMSGGWSRGVNVLLYGPPGMGKTSLARVTARHAGLRLLDVGETGGHGWEPSARERLGELRLAQNLLEGDGGSVLLLDEMDDVLDGDRMFFPWFPGQKGRRGRNGSSRTR